MSNSRFRQPLQLTHQTEMKGPHSTIDKVGRVGLTAPPAGQNRLLRWHRLLNLVDASREDLKALEAAVQGWPMIQLGRFLMHHSARGPLVIGAIRECLDQSPSDHVWGKAELLAEVQKRLVDKVGPISRQVGNGYLVAATVLYPEITARIRRGDGGLPWTSVLRTSWRRASSDSKSATAAPRELPLFEWKQ